MFTRVVELVDTSRLIPGFATMREGVFEKDLK